MRSYDCSLQYKTSDNGPAKWSRPPIYPPPPKKKKKKGSHENALCVLSFSASTNILTPPAHPMAHSISEILYSSNGSSEGRGDVITVIISNHLLLESIRGNSNKGREL